MIRHTQILVALLTYFFSFSAISDDEAENRINNACHRHAVSLVSQLKNDVVKDMDNAQMQQALKIVTQSCQAHLNQEINNQSLAVKESNTPENQEDDSVGDWLTDKILGGDTDRKEGNKRLDRIRKK